MDCAAEKDAQIARKKNSWAGRREKWRAGKVVSPSTPFRLPAYSTYCIHKVQQPTWCVRGEVRAESKHRACAGKHLYISEYISTWMKVFWSSISWRWAAPEHLSARHRRILCGAPATARDPQSHGGRLTNPLGALQGRAPSISVTEDYFHPC